MLASLQVIAWQPKGIFLSFHAWWSRLHYHSSGNQGAVVASVVPGVNIVKVLLIGFGIMKDEATVKSMSRFGDYRFFNILLILWINSSRPVIWSIWGGRMGALRNGSKRTHVKTFVFNMGWNGRRWVGQTLFMSIINIRSVSR
jgi:hypothetical protein